MSDNSYPVDTLWQMADIPVEALPRFLAELPSMLAQISQMKEIERIFNETFAGDGAVSIESTGAVWVDDDKHEVTKTMAFDEAIGLPPVTIKHKLPGSQ